MAEGGRNICTVQASERDLLEVQARPFGAAIDEAGLESVMCAYSDVNGEPAAASRHLLTDMLRGTLGFEGLTVADYGAVNALATRQMTAIDAADAGVQALAAGLDVELPGSLCYTAGVAAAVGDGRLNEAVVDQSVRRVLDAKFRLGLFENPNGDVEAFAATIAEESISRAQAIARRIATRSTVLLANPDGLLPLRRDLSRVAVVGPNAASIRNLFGGYSAPLAIEMMTSGDMGLPAPVQGGEVADDVMAAVASDDTESSDNTEAPKDTGEEFGFVRRIATRPSEPAEAAIGEIWGHVPTVLASIEATVSDATEVVYALGCHVHDPSTDGIPEAVAAATDADVAILVLGDKTGLVADAVVGETRDRTTLELAGAQRPLLDAVCATGVPVVVVLVGSQPVPVYAGPGGPAAVVNAYQPGSVGGVAIADVLFGIENPSGRTPITTPRTAGQCPLFHGYKNGSEPGTYTDIDDSGPAYPFGHGLSYTYTSFEYRSLMVDRAELSAADSVDVSVEVANTGDRFGEEVVQLYASITRRGVTRPVRELVGFSRVALDAGGVATVTFTLRPEILAYYDVDMNLVMAPGDLQLMAGPSSAKLPLSATLTVTGEPLSLVARAVHLTMSTIAHH
jgi:beta-glucosidase